MWPKSWHGQVITGVSERNFALMIICGVALYAAGKPFVTSGLLSIMHGSANMDVLITISAMYVLYCMHGCHSLLHIYTPF